MRGYRRVSATTPAPAPPAITAPIAFALSRSPAQPRHDWVTSPTLIARRRETADSGSGGIDSARHESGGAERTGDGPARADDGGASQRGGRRTSRASAAPSTAVRANASAS